MPAGEKMTTKVVTVAVREPSDKYMRIGNVLESRTHPKVADGIARTDWSENGLQSLQF